MSSKQPWEMTISVRATEGLLRDFPTFLNQGPRAA